MTSLNPLAVVEQVERWNVAALVYQNGNIRQQITKYYRMLGTVAEGVQKMDSLLVSAGVGQAVTTLIGVLGFYSRIRNVSAEHVSELILKSALNNIPPGLKYGNDYNTMLFEHHKVMTEMFDVLLENQEAKRQNDIVFYTKLAEALALLLSIATSKDIVVTRSILNAVNKLEVTQGVMNELGLFVKTVTGNK
ncbi:hypothetical protein pEaSNUABM11_00260 [Erwinia phage pEa_SNUABM_11]|nr:hypothetical protein pEaSNUABM11_00260 [Erwinia phage pEa_SNUABM_11]